ncbi:MAG: hypothetical protein O2971_01230 [Proteobacteria bacterium]|nr:hypothetical protein [Pseudomonadota bacterium]
MKRSSEQPHKKRANQHDPAIKHEKQDSKRSRSKDIHEDRETRKQKLAKPK